MAKRPWYPRYPSDYSMATKKKKMSLAEHGAYALLMDSYYFDGELVGEAVDMHSICNAQAVDEVEAVDKVLAKFFTKDGSRYFQDRIEEELEKFKTISAAKQLGAKKRWEKTQNDAYAMDKVCQSQSQSQSQEPASGEGLADARLTVRSEIDPPAKPSNSVKNTNRELRENAKEILAYLNRSAGKGFHEVDANLDPIMARLKEGASVEQAKSVVFSQVTLWTGKDDMEQYIRPETLFRKSKFWSYLGNITAPPPENKFLDPESQRGVESSSPGDSDANDPNAD